MEKENINLKRKVEQAKRERDEKSQDSKLLFQQTKELKVDVKKYKKMVKELEKKNRSLSDPLDAALASHAEEIKALTEKHKKAIKRMKDNNKKNVEKAKRSTTVVQEGFQPMHLGIISVISLIVGLLLSQMLL